MGFFQSSHKQTKKSYLLNAAVAFAIGAFMIVCIFFDQSGNPRDYIIGAGIVWLMGAYWVYKHIKFDDKDFNDPFNLRK